jgi:hypothetical protein
MKKFLQKIADFIVNRIKNAKNDVDADTWFDIGMKMNAWLVKRNIWLS